VLPIGLGLCTADVRPSHATLTATIQQANFTDYTTPEGYPRVDIKVDYTITDTGTVVQTTATSKFYRMVDQQGYYRYAMADATPKTNSPSSISGTIIDNLEYSSSYVAGYTYGVDSFIRESAYPYTLIASKTPADG